MIDCDVAVIGAGVVGIACAALLARNGHEVVIIEAADRPGTGASSRNSEVIHAGIYYEPGSRMARCCRRGRSLLLEYCRDRGIAHRLTGKFIVAATPAETKRLHDLGERARRNGVEGITIIDGDAAGREEPELRCHAALWSPETGIVDSHALLTALLRDAECAGATLCLATHVERIDSHEGKSQRLEIRDREGRGELLVRWVINAAGAGARVLAARGGGEDAVLPAISLVKGRYFRLSGPSPFSRLIYPLPDSRGLGIHSTLDLAGATRFGPDAVPARDASDLDVEEEARSEFLNAIERYWPGVRSRTLLPDYAGIRTRSDPRDFHLLPALHDGGGAIHLLGIESPGLTACLALAEEVCSVVEESG